MQLLLMHSELRKHRPPFATLHAPIPLHADMFEQAGAESVPLTGMFVHVPFFPAALHSMQTLSHAVSQQRLSTQKPLLQAVPSPHISPLHSWHGPPQSTPVSLPSIFPLVHDEH